MPKSKQPNRQELGNDELRALFSSLGLSAQTTERAVQMRCKLPAEGADDASRHGSRSVRRERATWKHCFQFEDRRQIPPMFGGKTSAPPWPRHRVAQRGFKYSPGDAQSCAVASKVLQLLTVPSLKPLLNQR